MVSDSATNIKNRFGAYIAMVKRGEVVTVLEHGKPVAQIIKPEFSSNEDIDLSYLEREGLISLPKKNLYIEEFFKKTITLKTTEKNAFSKALRKERDESR